MQKKFLELSLEEIDKAFNEAWNGMSEEEEQELFEEADIYSYMTPKLPTKISWIFGRTGFSNTLYGKLSQQKSGIEKFNDKELSHAA